MLISLSIITRFQKFQKIIATHAKRHQEFMLPHHKFEISLTSSSAACQPTVPPLLADVVDCCGRIRI